MLWFEYCRHMLISFTGGTVCVCVCVCVYLENTTAHMQSVQLGKLQALCPHFFYANGVNSCGHPSQLKVWQLINSNVYAR